MMMTSFAEVNDGTPTCSSRFKGLHLSGRGQLFMAKVVEVVFVAIIVIERQTDVRVIIEG